MNYAECVWGTGPGERREHWSGLSPPTDKDKANIFSFALFPVGWLRAPSSKLAYLVSKPHLGALLTSGVTLTCSAISLYPAYVQNRDTIAAKPTRLLRINYNSMHSKAEQRLKQ